jgi:hypothetical protein
LNNPQANWQISVSISLSVTVMKANALKIASRAASVSVLILSDIARSPALLRSGFR